MCRYPVTLGGGKQMVNLLGLVVWLLAWKNLLSVSGITSIPTKHSSIFLLLLGDRHPP